MLLQRRFQVSLWNCPGNSRVELLSDFSMFYVMYGVRCPLGELAELGPGLSHHPALLPWCRLWEQSRLSPDIPFELSKQNCYHSLGGKTSKMGFKRPVHSLTGYSDVEIGFTVANKGWQRDPEATGISLAWRISQVEINLADFFKILYVSSSWNHSYVVDSLLWIGNTLQEYPQRSLWAPFIVYSHSGIWVICSKYSILYSYMVLHSHLKQKLHVKFKS